MSIGRHTDEPAPVGTVVRVLQRNAGLRAHLGRFVYVSRAYRVPYLAGSSIDGGTVYIDGQTPELFPISRIEPDEGYPPHEQAEWWLMVMLGMDYDRAHRLAHGVEQYRLKLAGVSDERIEQYEAESRGLVNIDEHLALPPEAFPPDLYLGPYESDEDKTDKRLLPLLQTAQMIRRNAA